MKKFFAVSGALFFTFGLAGCGDPMVIEGCASSETVHVICGIEKPEDLEPLGDHPWMLGSELGSANIPGSIVALNLNDETMIRLVATVAAPDPASTIIYFVWFLRILKTPLNWWILPDSILEHAYLFPHIPTIDVEMNVGIKQWENLRLRVFEAFPSRECTATATGCI